MDASALLGRFPFRARARSDAGAYIGRMSGLGFGGALVSAVEAVFAEDSYQAERELAEEISDRPGLLHLKIVNPERHWWRRDLENALETLRVAGIRLVPWYHGYDLDDPRLGTVLDFAEKADLPIAIHYRMQDYRTLWMLRPPEPADGKTEDLKRLLERRVGGRLVIAGLHFSDMLSIADSVKERQNVLLDTSRLKGPWRTLEKLNDRMPVGRLLTYGSLWPLCTPECPLEQIAHSRLSESEKEGILGGNLRRLLGTAVPEPRVRG
jgi:predicted TIM-barrel fold metal-dependent hydrolase